MEVPQFSYNDISSVEGFTRKLQENSNSRAIKIINCLSASAVINLLSQDWFKNNLLIYQVISLDFTINGNIVEEELPMISFHYPHKLMITFEFIENRNCVIIFKNHGINEPFKRGILSAHGDEVRDFIVAHVQTSLAQNLSGLLPNIDGSTDLEINSFVDQNGFNLLMMASQQNQVDIVMELISLKCFNVNHKVGNMSAISLAWNGGFYDIVLDLLNANSLFPANFYLRLRTTVEIQTFVNNSLNIHSLISTHHVTNSNNENEISQILDQNRNLRYFFNPHNQSAAFAALSRSKFDIYGLLASRNVVVHPSEDLSSILNSLPEENQENIREIHNKHARCVQKQYLFRLYGNCFFGIDHLDNEEFWVKVIEAFETLDKIKLIQPILKLVSHAGKFKIFFDFHRDSVQFLDPTGDEGTNGLFYFNGLIYVAAKSLLDEETRNEAIGVLAHELCHFAMVLVYRNGARPYAVGDLNVQQEFENISNICELMQNFEEIIRLVYEHYGRNVWHQELIVRIPHILGHYFNDPTKIEDLLTSEIAPFRVLYNFYRVKVLPHIKSAIPILSQITNEPNALTFNSLTPQLKSKVKNSKVLFQGRKLSLLKIVEENSKAFDELSSDQLIKLINSEEIKISKIIEDNVEVYVERILVEKKNWYKGSITFDDLINEENLVVLLCDFAGAGKTTALIKVVHKLKLKFNFKWIQFIDLKSHFDAFKKFKEQKFETLEELSTFLCSKVLKLDKKKLESEIFVELFAAGKIVFLFDGVDEISPSFNQFACNLFLKINQLTKNIQWISTRPECVDQLKNILFVRSFEFFPLTSEEEREILNMIFTKQNLCVKEIESRSKIANEIIEKISSRYYRYNPLILKMIADESLDHEFTKPINIFTLFENFFNRKQKIVYDKGDEVQKDCIKASSKRMTISQVHQHYALKLIFKYGICGGSFESLNILTKNVPWTANQINRYGILYLHPDKTFSFVHRNFAEFFACQYIIENIYDCDESPREDEAELRVKLLFDIIKNKKEVFNFFQNYLDLEVEPHEVNETIKSAIISEFKLNYDAHLIQVEQSIKIFPLLIKFFDKNYDSLKSLWYSKKWKTWYFALRKDKHSRFKVSQLDSENEKLKNLIKIKKESGNFLSNTLTKENEDFFSFLKLITSDVSISEFKEIFLENSAEIICHFKKITNIWIIDELEKMLTTKEWKQLTKTKRSFFSILFSCIVIDEVVLKRVTELTEKVLSSEEIILEITNSKTFFETVERCNKNIIFDLFWKFINRHVSTKSQIREILCQKDDDHYTSLMNSVKWNRDLDVVIFLVKIYEEYFTREEQKKFILKWLEHTIFFKKHFLFGDIIGISTHINNVNEFVEYLKKIFSDDREAFKKLMSKQKFDIHMEIHTNEVDFKRRTRYEKLQKLRLIFDELQKHSQNY